MKKTKVLVAGLLAMAGIGGMTASIASQSNSRMALAEEVEVAEEEVVEEEQPAEEVKENWLKNVWDTYLLPTIASVSITSIVTAAISIVLMLKNRKTQKNYEVKVGDILAMVLKMTDQMFIYISMLAERNSQVKELLDALQQEHELAQKQIALFEEQKVGYENLRKSVVGLLDLEVELASINPDFVKSGFAEQLVELKVQLLKEKK